MNRGVALQTTKFVDRSRSGFPAWLRFTCLSLGFSVAIAVFAQTPASGPAEHAQDNNKLYIEGLALVKQGKLDHAITTFQKALESNGHDPLLLSATGAAYSLKGSLQEAKEYFLKCLEENPAFAPARKNLAITYFSLGQYDLAAGQFQKLRDVSPAAAPVANLFLGMIAERKANHLQAVNLLEDSGGLLDQFPESVLALAQAELQLARLRKAQETLAKFGTAPGVTGTHQLEAAELYSRLAHAAQKKGELALAIESLRQAAKLNPAREDNYLDFSSICGDYGNYPLALEGADIGLDHIPNSYRLLVQKGVVLENLGRLEEAEAVLRKAAQLQKDDSVALLSLAIVQTHAGQLHDAELTLTSALKDYPDNYYMHYHLGKVLLQLQEGNSADTDLNTKAEHEFEEAIRCNPSFADSYYQLSKLLLPESPKRAEQNLARCLQLDPNHAPAEYSLARLYLSTGRRAAGQALIDRFERQRQAEKVKDSRKPRIELAKN